MCKNMTEGFNPVEYPTRSKAAHPSHGHMNKEAHTTTTGWLQRVHYLRAANCKQNGDHSMLRSLPQR